MSGRVSPGPDSLVPTPALLPVPCLQALDAPPEALALLQGLPHLVSLDLQSSRLQDEQLAGLQGLSGLEALNLSANRHISSVGLQALLPRLQRLTRLELLDIDLGEEGFELLAQQMGLRYLVCAPDNAMYDGLEQLSRLQHLTALGAPLWEVDCSEEGQWALLCSSSLRVLSVVSVSFAALGAETAVCQVSDLEVQCLSRSTPLLPKLSKLVVAADQEPITVPHMEVIMQHTTLTELTLSGLINMNPSELACLARLPRLRTLSLKSLRTSVLEITDAMLKLILRRCTGLERLALVGLHELTDQGLDWIADMVSPVRSLEVSECEGTTAEGLDRALRVLAMGGG